ncbi:MAG: zinc-binding dehydrogenase [Gemmatimonadetes bacterium]|nr:zinc-binding dehydrogenase [Gemmatimonadota bacterium]
MAMPLAKVAPGEHMVFTQMARVSIAALRSSSVQPGDKVLVGNFACQLFRLAGADVMLADLSDLRLEQARSCGIEHTVNSEREDLEAAVKDWTDGVGARVGVEAIGMREVVAQTVMCTARYGEVILLGCPRAHATSRRDSDAVADPPQGDQNDRGARGRFQERRG